MDPNLMSYATARGVRVIAELDLPGHSAGLQRGAPHLYINCSTHPLPDPTGEDFFQLVDSIVSELVHEFPDEYLHMGGDEVDIGCWTVSGWFHTHATDLFCDPAL